MHTYIYTYIYIDKESLIEGAPDDSDLTAALAEVEEMWHLELIGKKLRY
jgi:hypothetical protein